MNIDQFPKNIIKKLSKYPSIHNDSLDPELIPALIAPVKLVIEWLPSALEGIEIVFVQRPLSSSDKCHVFECSTQSIHFGPCIGVPLDNHNRQLKLPRQDQIISHVKETDWVIRPFRVFQYEHELIETNIKCAQMAIALGNHILRLAGDKHTCVLHGSEVYILVPSEGTVSATLEFKVFFSFN